MNDTHSGIPHFLRVVRALARVRGAAIPIAVSTVIAGTYCGCTEGAVTHPPVGTGGASSSSSGYGGQDQGLTLMDGGYDGGPVGDMTMPDAGSDGG